MEYSNKMDYFIKNPDKTIEDYERYIKDKNYNKIVSDVISTQKYRNEYYRKYCYDYILCVLYMAQFRDHSYIYISKDKTGEKFCRKSLSKSENKNFINNIDFLIANFLANDRNEIRIDIYKLNIDKKTIHSDINIGYSYYHYEHFTICKILENNEYYKIQTIKHISFEKRFDIFMNSNIIDDNENVKLYHPVNHDFSGINKKYVCKKDLIERLSNIHATIGIINKSKYVYSLYIKNSM